MRTPGIMIDFGAIAKGYAADVVVEYLKSNNIPKAIINLGGNVYMLGSKDEEKTTGGFRPAAAHRRHLGFRFCGPAGGHGLFRTLLLQRCPGHHRGRCATAGGAAVPGKGKNGSA